MAAKKKARGAKVLRRVKLGKCSNVGNDIKAKGDSARSRRRRSQGGACLVRKRVARPVKTGMRTVLSPAEALRREAARKKKRAALRRGAAKRTSVKNGRQPSKWETIFVVQGAYGSGWEDLTAETTRKEARAQLKTYDANEHAPHRIISRKVLRADNNVAYKRPSR